MRCSTPSLRFCRWSPTPVPVRYVPRRQPFWSGLQGVPGLRRTEVATLAGMSVEYYSRLERGNLAGVSEEVLEALSRALELDEAERAHLYDLARASTSRPTPRKRAQPESVRQSLQSTLDAITTAPAVINNGRGDMVAANSLARALFSEMFLQPSRRPVNNARFVFLDPRATTFYQDWSKVADETVAALRTQAGQNPYDQALSDLVGELSTQSEEFRTRWPLTTSDSTTQVPNGSDTQRLGTWSSPMRSSASRPTT